MAKDQETLIWYAYRHSEELGQAVEAVIRAEGHQTTEQAERLYNLLKQDGGKHLSPDTYSKSLDQSSALNEQVNPYNPNLSKALSAFDLTHNFVVSYNYELPFDKLWRPGRLASGWNLTGITRFATGFPVTIQENDDHALIGDFSTGPNGNTVDEPLFTSGSLNFTDPRKQVLPGGSNPTGSNPYFNTSLFALESIGTLGNASRRFFHGPGTNNWDLALYKNLRLTESKALQFRAEFFNAFNHAQFGAPRGNIKNSSFGFVTSAANPRIGQVAIKFLF